MAKYIITGNSDDLIIINGDHEDEFSAIDCCKYLVFSDGTTIEAEYCPGKYPGWKIQQRLNPGEHARATVTRDPLDETHEDPDPYWDQVTVEGPSVRFVGCYETPEGPDEEELNEWASEYFHELPLDKKRAAYVAATT